MAPVQKQRNKAYFVKHILDLDLTNVLTTDTNFHNSNFNWMQADKKDDN